MTQPKSSDGPFQSIGRFVDLFLSKYTPLKAKAAVVLSVLYGLNPVDLIPEVIPLLGISDDIVLILLALHYFYKKARKPDVIDVEPTKVTETGPTQ